MGTSTGYKSSRRLEREAGRNVEVMWLLGRLAPPQDDCGLPQGQRRHDQEGSCALRRAVPGDGSAYMADASVAIDGSKFKAV
jgi:hypothetical protein